MIDAPPTLYLSPLRIEQVAELLTMIHNMAEDIQLPRRVRTTESDIRKHYLGGHAVGRGFLIKNGENTLGYVTCFKSISSSQGQPYLHLDDLYLKPHYRGMKLGTLVMIELQRIARQEHCAGLEWQVLKANAPAKAFYASLNSDMSDDYLNCSKALYSSPH